MRSDLLDRRRAMMDEWEKHLFSVIDASKEKHIEEMIDWWRM